MRGVNSHGVIRMIGYVECLQSGGVHCDAEPFIVNEGPSNALVNAGQGLGIPASVFANSIAEKKLWKPASVSSTYSTAIIMAPADTTAKALQ